MSRRMIWSVFLLSLVVRLLVVAGLYFFHGGETGLFWIDSRQYTDLAKNLVAGNGFALETEAPFIPDTLRTPGYPVFVAAHWALFGNLWSASVTQAILNAGLVVFAMWLTWRLTRKERVALVAGLMVALEPHLILYAQSLSTEGIFVPFLALFFYTFVRYVETKKLHFLVSSAVLIGVLALTRPVFAAFLPVALCLVAYVAFTERWKWRQALVHLCILGAIVMAFLGPWIYRNYKLSGQATLSTIGWVNMYTRLALTTEAAATGKSWGQMYEGSLQGLVDEGLIKNPAEAELYQAKFIPMLKERSLATLKKYPKEFILLQPISLNALFTSDNMFYVLSTFDVFDRSITRPPFSPSLMVQQQGVFATAKAMMPYIFSGPYLIVPLLRLMWILVFLASLYGSWVIYRRGDATQRKLLGFSWIVILFFAVTILPVAASIEARYRIPFESIYFPLAATGFVAVFSSLFGRKTKSDKHTKCLLCGGDAHLVCEGTVSGDAATKYAITDSTLGQHNDLYRCSSCGAVSQPFVGGASALAAAYAEQPRDTNYLAEERGRRRAFAEVLEHVEQQLPQKGKVLDIGGGPGLFLAEAKQRGWQVEGIEPSTDSVRVANENYGVNVTQGTVSDLTRYADGSFDLVTAFDVAEHLLEPSMLFTEVHRMLRKGGVFVWTTPRYNCVLHRCTGRWWYNLHPFHVLFFTRKSVEHVAKQFGFRSIKERSFKRYFSLGYVLFRLERFLPKGLVQHLRGSRLAGFQMPVQLYDEFELYFEKV